MHVIDGSKKNKQDKPRWILWVNGLFGIFGIAVILVVVLEVIDLKSEEMWPLPEPAQFSEAQPLPADPTHGQEWTNSLGIKFIYVGPGEFMMGSPEDEEGRGEDEQQHLVRLTKGYWLADRETTRDKFSAFVTDTGYKTDAERNEWEDFSWLIALSWQNIGEMPLRLVSWNDAQAFCSWLSDKEQMVYRLPTEAEWEYACRAGTTTAYYTGDTLSSTEHANFDRVDVLHPDGIARHGVAPVGPYPSNPWGFFSMYGNLSEWCNDWYGHYPDEPVTNPNGPQTGTARVVRGGTWAQSANRCRSASRWGSRDQQDTDRRTGFRILLEAQP